MSARAPRESRLWAGMIAAWVAVAAPLVPSTAVADGTAREEADKHFRQGVELYRRADFTAALVEFQRAHEIDAHYQVLYNVAQCQSQLQDWAGALKTFEKYLADGGHKLKLKRRKDVQAEIEKLQQWVAKLTVGTNEPGAKIAIDDIEVGTTPLGEPLLVSAGRRKVTATIAGRPAVTQVVQIAGGDDQKITLEIPSPPPPKIEVVHAPPRPSMAVPVAAWSGTGAVLTGAVLTGVLALGASSDLKEKLAVYPADAGAISSARSKTAAFALATDILGGMALAAAGVSIWLTVRHQRAMTDAHAPPAAAARLVVYPKGVGVVGSF